MSAMFIPKYWCGAPLSIMVKQSLQDNVYWSINSRLSLGCDFLPEKEDIKEPFFASFSRKKVFSFMYMDNIIDLRVLYSRV